MKLRVGDWVKVRSKEEILTTLDKNGRLEGMPFMPQMFKYCGEVLRVYKRAHKTCDTVNQTGGRRVRNCVHLTIRCDGETYGGCEAACLIFWKEAWLKPVGQRARGGGRSPGTEQAMGVQPIGTVRCSEEDVWTGTRAELQGATMEVRYVCQATQLPQYTEPLPWWDLRQYLEDCSSGNVTIGQVFRGGLYVAYRSVIQAGIGLGRPLRWLYDRVQSVRGGIPYPRRSGTIPLDGGTPACTLNLESGELVRVRSYSDILATLNISNKNRGLYFDAEMVPYCGKMHRVRARLNRFIDEKSGKLITIKTPAIILEGVTCQARYSDCRMFCPRSIYSWWREIWLERVGDRNQGAPEVRTETPSSWGR